MSRTINIVVMGKTGCGKSTLINTVLHENLAPTGRGQAVTRENKIYTKELFISLSNTKDANYLFNMYDTVGLEIDNAITDNTLGEIKEHISKAKQASSEEDIHIVWFCVNYGSSRFEQYEIDLIRKLSLEYEIPFIVVLTQCLGDDDELEQKIKKNLSGVVEQRILAKSFHVRGGKEIPSFGVEDLVRQSINSYKTLKVKILEDKLDELSKSRSSRIDELENRAKKNNRKVFV